MIKHRPAVSKAVRWMFVLLAVVLPVALSGCGGSGGSQPAAPPVAPPVVQIVVSVAPGSPSLPVGTTQQFTATVTGTSNTAVTWSVQEAGGGTIDNTGNYTAPMTVGSYHVVATSQADTSKSAKVAVSVTAAPPVFATVAPTDAAEATLYTYDISASDPAGTPVTLTLTKAPAGATLQGNTLSWTPTWNQSRVPNEFAVVAQSAAGGSATQSWSVSPAGTVYGHYLLHYTGGGGDITLPPAEPPQRDPGSMMAWVPQADGSLVVRPGIPHSDGTFEIPNVAAGPYLFSRNGHEKTVLAKWQTSSVLSWDQDVNGYPPLVPSQFWPEIAVVNVDGLDPFVSATDIFDIYDRDGYWEFTSILPDGETSYSWASVLWQNAPNATDRYVAAQIEGVSGTDPFISSVMGPAWVQPYSQINEGITSTYAGQLTKANPGSLDLNVSFSAFADAFRTAAPGTLTPAYFGMLAVSEVKHPNSNLSDPIIYGVLQVLANAQIAGSGTWPKDANGNDTWPADQNYGTLNYNNPIGAGEKTVYLTDARAQFSIPIPGTRDSLPWVVDISSASTAAPTGPIAPLMTPPANVKVGGVDLLAGGTINTAVPVVTWDTPTTRPTNPADSLTYELYICEPQVSTGRGGTIVRCVISLFVSDIPANSYTVPKGILQPGHSYIFMLNAVSERDRDPANPWRYSYPVATASTASLAITVAGSGGGKGVAQSEALSLQDESLYPETPLHSRAFPEQPANNHKPLLYRLPLSSDPANVVQQSNQQK